MNLDGRKTPLDACELDIIGDCFALKFIPRKGCSDLVELYIEDDDNWHYKCSFDTAWLSDLTHVTELARIRVEL